MTVTNKLQINSIEQHITILAIKRLAVIFKVSSNTIKLSLKFGDDLKGSSFSDFKYNELDIVLEDILDAMDRILRKEFELKKTTIYTVNDYCNHMILCYKKNPKKVDGILRYRL
jgi:hypothetical protein